MCGNLCVDLANDPAEPVALWYDLHTTGHNVHLVYVNVLRVRPFAMANASTYKLMLTTAVYAARAAPQGLRVQPERVTARRTRLTSAEMPALIYRAIRPTAALAAPLVPSAVKFVIRVAVNVLPVSLCVTVPV